MVTVTKPKRKHPCVWCRIQIRPGEKHLKFTGKWEGDFQNWRIHLECNEPMMVARDAYGDGSICDDGHDIGGTCEH